jgi:hypothetical protein
MFKSARIGESEPSDPPANAGKVLAHRLAFYVETQLAKRRAADRLGVDWIQEFDRQEQCRLGDLIHRVMVDRGEA